MGTLEARSTGYGSLDAPQASTKQDELQIMIIVTLLVCSMSLGEQFSTETFDGTQVFFMGNLKMDTKLNDGMKFARDRVYMVFVLICAKLGDCGLGRFWTIVLGSIIYFMGTIMVSLATHPWISRLVWYLLGAFLVIPFSEAAITSNILNFGADQLDASSPSGRQHQEHFFWWLNAATHSGKSLAFMLLAIYGLGGGVSHYLTNDDWIVPVGRADPEEYYTVFIASAGALFLAIVAFVWGHKFYSSDSLEDLPSSPVVGLTQYLVKVSSHLSFEGCVLLAAKVLGILIYVSQAALFWSPDLAGPLSTASAVGVVFSLGGIILFCRNVDWLDGVEKPENQPLSVSDVKDFLRLLPVLVCSQMAYGCLLSMMRTWYTRQACQMDLRFQRSSPQEDDSLQMFISFFDIYYCCVVIAGTPLVLYSLNPRIEALCNGCGIYFGDWSKYMVGVVFGEAAGFCAMFCEVRRRGTPKLDITSICAPHGVGVRAMSGYWMLAPYTLMAISTLYVVPTLMKVSYCHVPKTVRSLTVVTNIFMMSASQSLVVALSMFLKEFAPHDLDTGHLEFLYLAIIGMSVLLFLMFAMILPNYEGSRLPASEAELSPT